MNELTAIIIILFLHFIGDFFAQTDEMALNKSSSLKYLAEHAFAYSIPFIMFCFLFKFSYLFVVINTFTHFSIDYVTSKISKILWLKEKRHDFFVLIGFDQFIHVSILMISFWILNNY